jgi:hypothetical protein
VKGKGNRPGVYRIKDIINTLRTILILFKWRILIFLLHAVVPFFWITRPRISLEKAIHGDGTHVLTSFNDGT